MELDYFHQKVNIKVAPQVAEWRKTYAIVGISIFQENAWNA